jgi:HEAT repeat protein
MSLLIQCPGCRKTLRIPDTLMGKSIKCPSCSAPVPVQEAVAKASPASPARAETHGIQQRSGRRTSPPVEEIPPQEEAPARNNDSGRPRRRPVPLPAARSGKGRILLWSLVGGGLAVLVLGGVGLWLLTREATIPDAEWKEFSIKGQRFRVLMPGTPKQAPSRGKLDPGPLYGVDRQNGKVAFMIGFAPIPAMDLQRIPWEQRFKAALQTMQAKQPGSTVRTEKAISLDGHPGKEYEIDVPQKGTLVVRFYGINDEDTAQFYTLMVGSPDYLAASADVQRFFGSFQLLGELGKEFETPVDPAELKVVGEGKTVAQWIQELEYQDPANRPAAAFRRREAARALARLGAKARAAVPALYKIYRTEPDGMVRLQIVHALTEMGPGAKNAIPTLLKILQSADQGYQRQAAEGLAKFGAEIVPTLLQVVPQPGAVKALGLMGPAAKGAVPALTALLKEQKDPWATSNILEALGSIGPAAKDAVPTVVDILKDKQNAPIWLGAVGCLGRIGPAAKDAVPALSQLLKEIHPPRPGSNNGTLRVATAVALVQIDPADQFARSVLKDCRTDPDAGTRLWAAAELIRLDPKDKTSLQTLMELVKKGWGEPAIKPLVEFGPAKEVQSFLREVALTDKNSAVRRPTVLALAKIDPRAAVPVLIKVLKDPDAGVRWDVIDALGKMGPTAKAALAPLQETARKDKNNIARIKAFHAQTEIKPGAAVTVWIEALQDPDGVVYITASDALGKMGSAAKEAIPALQKLLQAAKEPATRARISKALEQIQGTKKN